MDSKVQKFGVQATKSPVIMVYRHGDKHHEGKRIVVSPKQNLEQFLFHLSKEVGVVTGPVRHLNFPNGKLVKSMEDIVDGESYVACGGEKFAADQVPTALLKSLHAKEASSENAGAEGSSASAHNETKPKPPIQKFGVQTEKAKVIKAYRHNDRYHEGITVTVHQNKFKTLDQLLLHLSKELQLVTGPVRHLYTADGKLVKALEDLVDGQSYVGCGGEKFSRENLPAALQ